MKLLRKAQTGGLQGFILSIVTVSIVLAIGLIVLQELRTTTKELGTTTTFNESVAGGSSVSQSGELFIGANACRNASMVTHTIGTTCNFTSTGGVTLVSNFSGNGFIDYTHYVASAAYNSTGSLITKLATVPTWIGIIIIVALAFIVLSFFIGKRQ